MKKVFVLAMALFCLIACAAALAEGAATSADGYAYTVNADGQAEIVGYTGDRTRLIVPSQLDGHVVVSIGENAFADNAAILDVNVPGCVKIIREGAFRNLSALTEVIISEGVEEIECGAFDGCPSLTGVGLPTTMYMVYGNPFINCPALEEIYITEDNPYFYLEEGALCDTEFGRIAFCLPAVAGTEYDIPSTVAGIGVDAFRGSGLTRVTVPDSVMFIESGAFAECASLEKIILPASVMEIADDAFTLGDGYSQATFEVEAGSYAEEYCRGLGLNYTITED